MFDLEQAIELWRSEMARTVGESESLDELEVHLRDEFAALKTKGMADEESFRLAVTTLGDARVIGKEFQKIHRPLVRPVVIGFAIWVVVAIQNASLALIMSAQMMRPIFSWRQFQYECNEVFIGTMSLHEFILNLSRYPYVNAFHGICWTTGIAAGFLAGCFGVWHWCNQRFYGIAESRQARVRRAIRVFSFLGVWLMLPAFLWDRFTANNGIYLSLWHPIQFCRFYILLWLIVLCVIQSRRRTSPAQIVVFAISGDIAIAVYRLGLMIYWGPGIFGTLIYPSCLLLVIALNITVNGWRRRAKA